MTNAVLILNNCGKVLMALNGALNAWREKMKAIEVLSMEQLETMYKAFEEIGLTHRYSEEMGEFEVKLGEDQWLMFFVDPQVLSEERDAEAWAEDAYAVADTYWRQ